MLPRQSTLRPHKRQSIADLGLLAFIALSFIFSLEQLPKGVTGFWYIPTIWAIALCGTIVTAAVVHLLSYWMGTVTRTAGDPLVNFNAMAIAFEITGQLDGRLVNLQHQLGESDQSEARRVLDWLLGGLIHVPNDAVTTVTGEKPSPVQPAVTVQPPLGRWRLVTAILLAIALPILAVVAAVFAAILSNSLSAAGFAAVAAVIFDGLLIWRILRRFATRPVPVSGKETANE